MALNEEQLNSLIENKSNISSINGKSIRKMGRPPKKNLKSKIVKVYLTKEEKEKLDKYITNNNITSSELLSEYIRSLI